MRRAERHRVAIAERSIALGVENARRLLAILD